MAVNDERSSSGNPYNYEDVKPPSTPLSLPSLMIGGAVFSFHYNADVNQVPTEAILSKAISAGANGVCPFFAVL